MRVVAVGGSGAEGPLAAGFEPGRMHEAGHAFFAGPDAGTAQLLENPGTAIGLAAAFMDAGDLAGQLPGRTGAGAFRPFQPAVVTTAGNSQSPGQFQERIILGQGFHKGISFGSGSWERMPSAFFRISFLRWASWSSF